MRIKVLGCSGAGFPGHNPSGFLLDDRILFDAGSLTNVLQGKDQKKIEYIFVTHAHLDHVTGIPFLAESIISEKKWHRINVISIPPVIRTLKKNLLNSSVWPDFTVIPSVRDRILNLIEMKPGESALVGGYTVTSYRVNHSVPTAGYLIENKVKRRVFYTGDTGPSSATWKRLGKMQIHSLIIEVSFPNRMEDMARKTGHLTPRLLGKELLKINHPPERIYITHLKPQYIKTIRTELQQLKNRNLRLLRDGETLTV